MLAFTPVEAYDMRRLSYLLLALIGVVTVVSVAAQERIDQGVYWKIRQEATGNSKILQTLHMLTDVYGPRLTGSPNLKAAGEWAIEQMHAWGMKNGHLEPWDWGKPGWTNERLSAHIVSPVKDALVVEALAWTPGTNGVARGQALQMTCRSDQLATRSPPISMGSRPLSKARSFWSALPSRCS